MLVDRLHDAGIGREHDGLATRLARPDEALGRTEHVGQGTPHASVITARSSGRIVSLEHDTDSRRSPSRPSSWAVGQARQDAGVAVEDRRIQVGDACEHLVEGQGGRYLVDPEAGAGGDVRGGGGGVDGRCGGDQRDVHPFGWHPAERVEAGDRGTDGAGGVLGDGPVVEDEDAAVPLVPPEVSTRYVAVDRPGSIPGRGDGLLADLPREAPVGHDVVEARDELGLLHDREGREVVEPAALRVEAGEPASVEGRPGGRGGEELTEPTLLQRAKLCAGPAEPLEVARPLGIEDRRRPRPGTARTW